ncbi:MAG: hypothetical protein EB142_04530, partial [Actinobacteria bacterium]|nr:hypothetical protein [Actinomycetota bacterium]
RVEPTTKACLDKTIGVNAANKIIAAKKLTAVQNKQVAKCKSSSAGAGGSASAPAGSTTSTSSDMVSLNYGLLSYKTSQRDGLGNISDPALLQVGSTLRMFFKNGNEPQIPLAGFDNKIHSYTSADNGKTWTLESGVRIDVGSPVTVRAAESGGYEAWGWTPGSGGVDLLTRFTSSTGKDFAKGSGAAVPTSACKNADGASAGFLGDPQVVKVASGYLAYAHDLAAGKSAPFKRQVCKLSSTDGVNWSIDASGTFAYQYDIQTNPETFRNAAGQLELWFPVDKASTKYTEIRTSTNDGASWGAATALSWMANDPDRLDLTNGDSLLAFGNFDHRKGGLLAVSKKISTSYSASRDEKVDQVTWTISGAKQSDVTVKNLCRGTNETANASFSTSGSNLVVTFKDTSVGCAFILVGASQAIS